MSDTTYTITAQPDQWRFVNAYEGFARFAHDPFSPPREQFGVVLTDNSLLPEEVANEARVSRDGSVYMMGWQRPAVEHREGWEYLENELRRMEATNRRKDDIFAGAVLEITFRLLALEPRPGSRYTTPLVVLPVSLICIAGYAS